MVTAAIAALAAIAAALPWPQYQQLLGQFLRLMRRHADGNKVLLPFCCCSWSYSDLRSSDLACLPTRSTT